MLKIKSKREMELMRIAGKMVADVLNELTDTVRPGVSLRELDEKAESLTLSLGARPAFKGYLGFRHTLCASVNEQVVHGVPNERVLREGDIIGLDFGLQYQGYFGDSAVTVPVGNISSDALQLMQATRDSLYAAIEKCHPGNSLKDLGRAVEGTVKPFNYGVVREFVGHGIGQALHEDPQIPNYESGASNLKLKSGMTICIEPMINAGSPQVKVLADKWTAVTVDGALSAHYEHTIAITDNGPEVLTEWKVPGFQKVFDRLMINQSSSGPTSKPSEERV
jgi:methionyl aminopeptidase